MSDHTHPVTLTADNFQSEVLNSSQPVLVDFWAAWCGPCRLIAPIVDAIATEYEGQVKAAKLNIDDYPELATQYGVHAIPTLLLFQAGRPVDQIVGVATKGAIAAKLDRLLEPNPQQVA
jgi:thioredoxin 1